MQADFISSFDEDVVNDILYIWKEMCTATKFLALKNDLAPQEKQEKWTWSSRQCLACNVTVPDDYAISQLPHKLIRAVEATHFAASAKGVKHNVTITRIQAFVMVTFETGGAWHERNLLQNFCKAE